MLMVIAKGIKEKNNFNLIEINRAHVGDLHVHSKNLNSTVTEGGITAIVEVESLLE